MAKVIDQDGNALVWLAVYMRYGAQYQDECEDLQDAVGALYWGQEAEVLSALRIVSPSGVVIEGPELEQALDEYERARESEITGS